MKIKVTLYSDRNILIPLQYQPLLQAVIYQVLRNSSTNFAHWLHQEGYILDNLRAFKFFCFSGLIFHSPIKIIKEKAAMAISPGNFHFYLSSPKDEFIVNFLRGLYEQGNEITIAKEKLQVLKTEACEKEELPEEIILKPLQSPVVVSEFIREDKPCKYLLHNDQKISTNLIKNLIYKYKALYKKEPKFNNLEIAFCPELLPERSPTTRLITYKGYNGTPDIHIKGSLVPFRISGDLPLVRLGMECGFGEKNSSGCGFVERML